MPEGCPVCEARRVKENEQARLRMAKLRERRKVTGTPVRVTPIDGEAAVTGTPPPSHTLPSPGLSTTDRLLERLAPFANRAFKPDPAFLALLAERYPGVDLEVELAAALDWLEEPRHAKRRCSKGFLANWIKKADADRKAREALPPPMPPANGHTWNGVYVQPNSLRHNRQPPLDDERLPLRELLPIAKEEFQRTVAANRGLTLDQKRARLTARLTAHAPEGGKP